MTIDQHIELLLWLYSWILLPVIVLIVLWVYDRWRK